MELNHFPKASDLIERLAPNHKTRLYDLYYDISTSILHERLKRGLTQKELAAILGVSQVMVSKLESGEYNYTVEQLHKIASCLGMELSIVLGAPDVHRTVTADQADMC